MKTLTKIRFLGQHGRLKYGVIVVQKVVISHFVFERAQKAKVLINKGNFLSVKL